MQQTSKLCQHHQNRIITLICLHKDCKNRLGCERCLLSFHKQHLSKNFFQIYKGSCIHVRDLGDGPQPRVWTNDREEETLQQFLEQQRLLPSKIVQAMNDILAHILSKDYEYQDQIKTNKKNTIIKITKELKQQNNIISSINRSLISCSNSEFKELWVQLSEKKISQKEFGDRIRDLITKRRTIQEDMVRAEKTQNYKIDFEHFIEVARRLREAVSYLKNLVVSNLKLDFVLSPLTPISGLRLDQMEFDQKQNVLIYSSRRISSGVHTWTVNLQPSNMPNKQSQQDANFFQNIGSQNKMNSPFYQNLGRFFVGIVDDQQKDQKEIFNLGNSSCIALDIIKQQTIGSIGTNVQPGDSSAINSPSQAFIKQAMEGNPLIMNIELNMQDRQQSLQDVSSFSIKYQGFSLITKSSLSQLPEVSLVKSWRPFICSNYSAVKVAIS